MLIDKRCPHCGEAIEFENTMESMFCPFCGGMVTNEAFDLKETPISNEPNLYISYNSTDPSVGMVTRIVSTGVKNTYINGQSLSFHLAQGPQTIVLKIGSRNYNRDIVIPSDNSPVRIYASYNGRAHIAIDQPQTTGSNSNSSNGGLSGNYSTTQANNTANSTSATQGTPTGKQYIFGIIGFVILIFMVRSCLFGGSSSSSSNSQTTNIEHNYSTINIETSNYFLGDIIYEAPSSWYYKESNKYRYYYPDKNDTNVFLMVFSQESKNTNLSKAVFESSFMDGVQDGFTEDMQNVKILSREVEQRDNFYFGKINLKGDFHGAYRNMIVCCILDNKTGVVYCLEFTQPENISEENEALFNYVCDSFRKK